MKPRRDVAQIRDDLEREKWAVQVRGTLTGILVGAGIEVALWILRVFIPTAFGSLPTGSVLTVGLILGVALGAFLNSWADNQPEGRDR